MHWGLILLYGKHTGEDAAGAVLAAIAFSIIVWLIGRIKGNKKEWEDIDKKDKK